MPASTTIQELEVKIGSRIGDALKGFDRLQMRAKKLSKSITRVGGTLTRTFTTAVAGAGAAAFGAAVKIGNAADELLDLEQQTGLSTDSLQEFRRVAAVAGVEQDTLAKATQQLTMRMSRGAEGSADMRRALESLGVEAKDAEGNLRPMDAIVNEALSSLASMEDVTQRNVLATQLFSRSATDLAPILGLGSDEIRRLREEAHDMGLVIGRDSLEAANDFRIAFDTLKQSLGAVVDRVGIAVIPIMQDLVEMIQDKVVPALSATVDLLGDMEPKWVKLGAAVAVAVGAIGPLVILVGKLIGVFAAINPVVLGVTLIIGGLGALAFQLAKDWDGFAAFWMKMWVGIKLTVFEQINDIIRAFEKAVAFIPGVGDKITDLAVAFEDFASRSVLNSLQSLQELKREYAEQDTWLNRIRNSFQQVKNALTEFSEATRTTTNAVAGVEAPLSRIDQLLASFEPKVAGATMRIGEMVPNLGEVKSAFKSAGDGSDEMQKAVSRAAGTATSAIERWTQSSGRNIGSLVTAALRDLGRLAAKMAIFQTLKAILGAPTGGIGGALLGGIGSVFGFAEGGFLGAGRVGLVGEEGPELIQAGPQGATITPMQGGAGNAGAVAGEILSRLGPAPVAQSPREVAISRWYRELFSEMARDGVDRGVSFA